MIIAFGSPTYFTDRYIPSNTPGVDLKLPNYDALFDDIRSVSPLARQALSGGIPPPGGIRAIDDESDEYRWKVVEDGPDKLVSHIDKIDNFRGRGVPIVRFRSTMRGPTRKRAECFSELISVAAGSMICPQGKVRRMPWRCSML